MAVAKFRSRARVIDLLGRQQIADAPTAVGELFKNALDAGARSAWVNFEPERQLLALRDDGLGMRAEDVTDKWLVLATDSRLSGKVDSHWSKYADREQREWLNQPSYGEKGIGRLSVATLGRMTLLWTVWGRGSAKTGTLCLVHWHLFQHPTMLFEDLPVPFLELDRIPSVPDLRKLFGQLKSHKTVRSILASSWDAVLQEQLHADISMDPGELFEGIAFPWEMGTSFYITPTSDQVDDLFLKHRQDTLPSEDYPPDWLKAHHAFSTFWDPFHVSEDRHFKVHASLSGMELPRVNRYWEPSDFQQCDHHVRINVSKDGFAEGFVKNYKKRKALYERQLKALPRGHISPGEFLVEIGYLQGNREISPLPDDDYREVHTRLLHAGGFSIYLNKVRVQPYGSIDNDFAGFEERRLKNAGRYYFSTRRMFGGVFIPSKEHTELMEKAGREGFIVNGARRGLRLWIEDLFVDLADTFFGRKAEREDKSQRKKRKEAEAARMRLEKERGEYLAAIRTHRGWLRDFEARAKRQVWAARNALASETNSLPGAYLNDCEAETNALQGLIDELHETPAEPPTGVVLEDDTLAAVEEYLSRRDQSLRNLNLEIARQSETLHKLRARVKGLKDQEKAVVAKIGEADGFIRTQVLKMIEPAISKSRGLEDELVDYAETHIQRLIGVREGALHGLSAAEIAQDRTGKNARLLASAIQRQRESLERRTLPSMSRLVDDLMHLTTDTSSALVLEDQSRQFQMLKERQQFLVEVAQLGLVFEAASHEHEKQVSEVRSAIKSLSRTADSEELRTLQSLSDSFDIIDERIRLFDPLIRRRTSRKHDIRGAEIEEFLKRRFREEFERDQFVHCTEGFRVSVWLGIKRPIMLGAVHNIFHNAVFWSQKSVSSPAIRLSSTGTALVISDSGPGVNPSDLERIFEPGFSRRPFGRGLGLYIAQEALRGIGLQLSCPPEPELGALDGANFVISPKPDEATE